MSRARKIDPTRRPRRSPAQSDRIEIGPTALALAEWAAAGLALPDLAAMRRYRLDRLVAGIVAADVGGLLLFDPINIRYATDSTNMQVWAMHNPFRACLVLADGYMVLWDYKHAPFLAAHNPLVREVRPDAAFYYFAAGERAEAVAAAFAAEVADLLAVRARLRRLAVDKVMPAGLRALEAAGLQLAAGEPIAERARAVKSRDEVAAMRCALNACERAMAAMRTAARPGLAEAEIWAVLHAENIRRGGEWIETRLLASGPRTNPWFQECGPRVVQPEEVLAFDTDLIGPYGFCADISRTWWIGERPPAEVLADHALACEHIAVNRALLVPGIPFAELSARAHRLPAAYQKQKYPCLYHGVGLCDEWPSIQYPDERVPGAFEGVLEPGMTLCVEALVSREGARHSIKLEEQVLVTETGPETLSRFPLDLTSP